MDAEELSPVYGDNFCVVLRHDMDDVPVKIDPLKCSNIYKTYDSSTLFFLPHQISQLSPELIGDLGNREIALHSNYIFDLVPLLPNGVFYRYWIRFFLNKQMKKLSHKINHQLVGHAPHSKSNYGNFRTENTCWNIIRATGHINRALYYSDWGMPLFTPIGGFNSDLPHSFHRYGSINVFSTCWDDKSLMLAPHPSYLAPRPRMTPWQQLLFCVEHYKTSNAPAIFNFHPIYFSDQKVTSLYRQLIDYCESQRIPILRMKDLC